MHCVAKKCSLTLTEKCEECQQGYYIVDGNCQNCTENGCADMECNPKTGECTDCPEGYYLDNGKCVKCDEENEMKCDEENEMK